MDNGTYKFPSSCYLKHKVLRVHMRYFGSQSAKVTEIAVATCEQQNLIKRC